MPAGVTTLSVVATGAAGTGQNPGPGAVQTATLTVTPGWLLDITVGCMDGYGYFRGGAGGAGDGLGTAGGNGGGATGMGLDGYRLAEVVAAGGGGSGGNSGVLEADQGGEGGGGDDAYYVPGDPLPHPGYEGHPGTGLGAGESQPDYPNWSNNNADGEDGGAAPAGSDAGGGGGGGGGSDGASPFGPSQGTPAAGGGESGGAGGIGGGSGAGGDAGDSFATNGAESAADTLGDGQLVISFFGPDSVPTFVTCSTQPTPYVVPDYVSQLKVVAGGAAGGSGQGTLSGSGGVGAVTAGMVSVTPGETFDVAAGCAGGSGSAPEFSDAPGGTGGYGLLPGGSGGSGAGGGLANGGGGGGGGGGASGISTTLQPTGTDELVLLAGGGGGAGGTGSAGGSGIYSGGAGGSAGTAGDAGAGGAAGAGITPACSGAGGSSGTPSDILGSDGMTGGSATDGTLAGGGGGAGAGYASGTGGGAGGVGECAGGGGAGAGSYLDASVTPISAGADESAGSGGFVDIYPIFTIPATATFTEVSVPQGAVYDGEPQAATAHTLDLSGNVIATPPVTYDTAYNDDGPPTDAGSYTATASYPGDPTHEPSSDSEGFTIAQAPTTIELSAPDAAYDGSPHGATADVVGAGGLDEGLIVIYNTVGGSMGTETTTPPTALGDYTATASYIGSANYLAAATQTVSFSITSAPPTFTSAAATTFEVGQQGTFGVTTATSGPDTITQVGGTLPPGVTLVDDHDGTAILSGTPIPGSSLGGNDGVYTFTMSADDGIPEPASQQFQLTVDPPARPANQVLPTITGTPATGYLLTASTGSWSSVDALTYTYQWEDCVDATVSCVPNGATGPSYTPSAADLGSYVAVEVTAADQDGQATTAVVATSGPVEPGYTFDLTPTAGSPQRTGTGQAFPTALGARITLAGTPTPAPGVPVTFTVTTGSATFTGGQTAVTVDAQADGTVTAPVLTAGSGAGPVVVTATGPSTNTLTYSLTVHPLRWALPASSGRPAVQPRSPAGVHLGVDGELWRLEVTHPTTSPLFYSGTITIDHGSFTGVRGLKLEPGDTFSVSGDTITFSFRNEGQLDGLAFTTPEAATALTLSVDLDGQPATAQQLFLGTKGEHPGTGMPTILRNMAT